ncbi:MAG TPA: acyl-CoA dehydrogenase family protein [Candidatus Acidoferrales bacterium]|nr:acyl-CoA dehydrogenase family protein [Candidatus Acidoferrales bacterium]
MSTQATMSEDELRQRVRKLIEEVNPDKVDMVTFRGAQFDHGLAWVNFPVGYGGLGLNPKMQVIVADELRKNCKTVYDDLIINPIGIGMGAATVLTYGSDELKKRLLRPCFSGEEVWCQLFSEPGAGSDVAGLATRAVRDGDDWVLNGQKVWTTLAHISRWGLLVARSNPDLPKHEGMSYFMLDMQSPGVDVRPLYQITGEAEFNEVFLQDVRIPHSRMLGKEGQGWQVALTTLMNERTALGGGSQQRGGGPINVLLQLWKNNRAAGESAAAETVMRDRITKLYIDAELLRLTSQRARAAQRSGNPGPEGSVGKLAQAELYKKIWECGLDVMGPSSLVYEPGYDLKRPAIEDRRDRTLMAKYQFLRSRANSIEGGTSEVMRNILGERVLGLPGEPRTDKGIPWKDVPRGG